MHEASYHVTARVATPTEINIEDMDRAAGGVVFGPFMVAFHYGGATAVAHLAGAYVGAGLMIAQFLD